MKITFIYPAVGKKPGQKYIHTWKMEPLPIATLAALMPAEVETEFFDDRVELIPYNTPTDLVAIPVETYTARRAYQIAARFRSRGVPVVMGGYHPTAVPQETARYADAVVLGNAERVWPQILRDAARGQLQPQYTGRPGYAVLPDRRLFANKSYLPLGLVETGRGCAFDCEFCAITSYYRATYHPRPVQDVVADIQRTGKKYVFFVDDNLSANPEYALELCRAVAPLRIYWASQASLTLVANGELLHWLGKSGCRLLLIGFESLDPANLQQMNKAWAMRVGALDEAVQRIHDAGISIYATFVFGFDHDTPASFDQALAFSMKHRFFFAAFNHLLPFPGTALYRRLRQENRLLSEAWWLDPEYTYGTIPFQPKNMNPQELSARCAQTRRAFFRWPAIWKRGMALFRRQTPLLLFLSYWLQNFNLQTEVDARLGLPLGAGLDEWPK